MTTFDDIRYLMTITGEEDQEPIRLTQNDFDQILAAGRNALPTGTRADAAIENTVAFATVETVEPDAPFLFGNDPIEPDIASLWCGKGIEVVLRSVLEEHRG